MHNQGLRRSLTLSLVVAAGIATAGAQPPAQAPARPAAIGRWNLTVQGPKGPYPSWLEVTLSGTRTLVGRFVGGGGSARPISRVDVNEGSIHFAIPPQWEKETTDLVFDATVTGDTLEGTLVTPAGERHRVRRPTGAVAAPRQPALVGAGRARSSTGRTSRAGPPSAARASGRPRTAS